MCIPSLSHHNFTLSLKPRAPSPTDKKTIEFSPAAMELGERDVNGFFKDCDRLKTILNFDGQFIYSKYKNEFDDLNDQPEKMTNLQKKIKTDFESYLFNHLGYAKIGLTEEISWRFSQKALSLLHALAEVHAYEGFKGIFQKGKSDPDPIETIILEPPVRNQPVKIRATREVSYSLFFPNGKTEMVSLTRPMHFKGEALYTIDQKGQTTAKVEFIFSQIKTRS